MENGKTMGARRNFRRGGESTKKAPLKTKKAPPPPQKKNCAITVLRELGDMLPRENFNNGAPYDILDASQQGRV